MLFTRSAHRYLLPLFLLFNATAAFTDPIVPDFSGKDEGILGKKVVSCGADMYNIVIDLPDFNGEYRVHAEQQGFSNTPPIDSSLFFVILPDGNFVILDQKYNYETKVRFQTSGGILYNVDSMQVTAFKKSDPTPPPGIIQSTPQYTGITSGSFTPAGPVYVASDYLAAGKSVKVGNSWTPWDYLSNSVNDNEFYYLIITYGNRTSGVASGTLDLQSCGISPTGFEAVTYNAFNLHGDNHWDSNQLFPAGSINFSGLRPGEVRHIYVKMQITGTVTKSVHAFRAIMKYSSTIDSVSFTNFLDTSVCTRFFTGDVPHDPNHKLVDQQNCTLNGTGQLIYTISYQNDGGAYADKVVICDQFPNYVNASSLVILDRSDNIPNLDIFYPWFGWCNKVKFTIGKFTAGPSAIDSLHRLPGLGQTNPRRYSYDETIGWIQFRVDARCPNDPAKQIENKAKITFYDSGNRPQSPFTTDPAITKPDDKPRPDKWPPPRKD